MRLLRFYLASTLAWVAGTLARCAVYLAGTGEVSIMLSVTTTPHDWDFIVGTTLSLGALALGWLLTT